MKAFKKLATLSMAVLMAFGVSAFAACGGDTTESSSPSIETSSTTSAEKTYTCYEFVVLNADGTKVEGEYYVQLCLADGACINYFAPVTNGVCVYTHNKVTEPGVYVPHVFDAERTEVKLQETVRTSADAFGEYTLILEAVVE